eukprot:11883735-Karenia_brevis.AAC.1
MQEAITELIDGHMAPHHWELHGSTDDHLTKNFVIKFKGMEEIGALVGLSVHLGSGAAFTYNLTSHAG